MVAPYAPTLISPAGNRGFPVGPATFELRYNAPDGEDAGDYYFVRRRLSPTVGTDEWLNDGGSWVGAATQRTAPVSVQDGDVVEVTYATDDWPADSVYEWGVQFENASAELGPASTRAVFIPRSLITTTFAVEDPSLDSRPVIRWSNDQDTQRGFRLAVFRASVYDDAAFDIEDPGWQAQAEWMMDQLYVSSDTFRYRIGVDLAESEDYRVLGIIEDRFGVSTGWQVGPEFSTNFEAPTAPAITFTPHPDEGVMDVNVDVSFNLADVNSSSFGDGVGQWERRLNCQIAAVGGVLVVTAAGMTFDEADTQSTTFNDEDSDYSDFEEGTEARPSEPTVSSIQYREDPYSDTFIPVVPTEDYSAIISAFPVGFASDITVQMRWYTAGGVYISTSQGTVSCPPSVWTEVPSGPGTAPGTAAYMQPRVVMTTDPDDVIHLDNFAVARSDSVVWTPGGLSVDLKFSVARSVNSGPWEFLWNASRTYPAKASDSNLTVGKVVDRAYPIGEPLVEYQVVALTEATGETIASAIAQEVAPEMYSPAWYLRCYDGTIPDMRFRAMDINLSTGTSNRVSYVQGARYGIVQESGDAVSNRLDMDGWLFDKSEYDGVLALLNSKKLLYVQRNIGDGFYIRVTGVTSVSQRRAVGGRLAKQPRHLHKVSFNAEVVGPPKDLTQ